MSKQITIELQTRDQIRYTLRSQEEVIIERRKSFCGSMDIFRYEDIVTHDEYRAELDSGLAAHTVIKEINVHSNWKADWEY